MPRQPGPRRFFWTEARSPRAWLAALLLGAALLDTPVRSAAAATPLADTRDGESTPAREVAPSAAVAAPGPPIDWPLSPLPRDASSWPSACSFRYPLCVHPSPGTADSQTAAALAAADRAWASLVAVMGAPPPDAGLDAKWHVFLMDAVDGGVAALPEDRDPVARFDRASSYAVVDRTITAGCELDLALARAVARGSLWRAAPATDPGSASAQTEMLARLAVPCAVSQAEAIEFQAHPDRALVDPQTPRFARGGALFFDWLDRRFGAEPGALVVGVWALAPTQTPPDSASWSRTPTGFDVLRVSLKGALWAGSTLDDIFVRFAVNRGAAIPPAHTAWRLPWPLRPRRMASPEPVSPTGAAYVLIDRAGAPRGAKLRLETEWEDYGRFRWNVVKLDRAGRSLGELAVTSLDRGTRAATTVESLDDVEAVLLVGVGLPATPGSFDPDDGEWEPHGWLLTVASE